MQERKGFGIRLGAYLIDCVLMVILQTVCGAVLGSMSIILAMVVAIALVLAYAMIEVMRGQSPGKMILGMKIGREDGSPASQDQLIRRTVIKFSPSIISVIAGAVAAITGVALLGTLGSLVALVAAIALLAMSWTPLQTIKQAYWDLQAKTAVFGKAGVVPVGFTPVMAAPAAPAPTAADPVVSSQA